MKPDPDATQIVRKDGAASPSAAEAAREARAPTTARRRPPCGGRCAADDARRSRRGAAPKEAAAADGSSRTTLVRGKMQVKRGAFEQDPVVGWLVVVGGPGIGQYRPIFEGNNTIGRSTKNRIAIDFGDDAISSEEQAYIRYDSSDRSFLFVPNLC